MTDDHADLYRAEGVNMEMRIADRDGNTDGWVQVATATSETFAYILTTSANVGQRRMAEVFTDAMIDSARGEPDE